MADIEKLVGSESRLEVGQKINEIIENKANKNLNNTGMLTNCLLEVPQRIKLELADGVLTLKAGSQVIVPNGFKADGTTPKFDEYVIDSDYTLTQSYDGNLQVFINIYLAENRLGMGSVDRFSSGTTAPLSSNKGSEWWYDTNTNLVKYYANGSYTGNNTSFPIAICTKGSNNDNLIASIDQTFNGMGYIGSTVWVDKGVKGLIPNGRNEDGSLKNVEWLNEGILVRTWTGSVTKMSLIFDLIGTDYNTHLRFFGSDCYLSAQTNIWVNNGSGILETGLYIELGEISTSSDGTVISLQPKLPFRVPDIQDVVRKTGDMMSGYLNFINYNIKDSTVTPSTSQYTGITFYDAKGQRYGKLEGQWSANGYTAFGFNASRTINGSIKYSNVSTWIDSDGGMNFSFPKCTAKATTSSSATSNRVAVVTQNYVNGTSWYRVWSDGWIEQGGQSSTQNINSTNSVAFSKSFANTNYHLSIAPIAPSSNANIDDNLWVLDSNISKTGFVLYATNTGAHDSYSGVRVRWYACGY